MQNGIRCRWHGLRLRGDLRQSHRVDHTLFDERITTLPERRVHEICEALSALANC